MRLGPISLASHLSFSSISLTALSDGLAGNHHPCIYRRILPPASFNTAAHMQNSNSEKSPGLALPPTPNLFWRSCVCVCVFPRVVYQMSEIHLNKVEMYSFFPFSFLWAICSRNRLPVSREFSQESPNAMLLMFCC